MTRANDWLNHKAKPHYSQRGEDGILDIILTTINKDEPAWCVEFGAWDGITGSNTYHFIKDKGYRAVLIEGDPDRFSTLQENMRPYPIEAVNQYVSFEGENSLDNILSRTSLPTEFSLLSIDIDGNDYHIWDSLTDYRAQCVVIEFNPSIPNEVEFVQPRDMSLNQGSSPASLVKLAKQKGYELVAATLNNLFFVESKYFDLFEIKDNSLQQIRTDLSRVTYLFNGYDGHVFIRGYGKLDLYSLNYSEKRIQLIPSWLQHWECRHPLTRTLQRIHRSLKKRGII